MTEHTLRELTKRAKEDEEFRLALLETRKADDPMEEFCKFATEAGFPITIGELLTAGEEYSCNQLKSTNGGGVNPYDYFDDPYEMFFVGIE